MADLHQQLLDATSLLTVAEQFPPEQLAAALRAVVELHAPRPCLGYPDDPCMHLDPHDLCTTCGPTAPYVIGDPGSSARCTTVQAIARELGVQEDNHHAR